MPAKTPEEIDKMRAEVAAFDQKQAQERAEAMRADAKPLIDLVGSDTFTGMEAAIPILDELSAKLPDLRVHVDAVRHGLNGLRMAVDLLPPLPAPPPVPANEEPPAA